MSGLIVGLRCPNVEYHKAQIYHTTEVERNVWACSGCGCKFVVDSYVGIRLQKEPDPERVTGDYLTLKKQFIEVIHMMTAEWMLLEEAEIEVIHMITAEWMLLEEAEPAILRLAIEWGLIEEGERLKEGLARLSVEWQLFEAGERPEEADKKTGGLL